jgi:hypothetical protein
MEGGKEEALTCCHTTEGKGGREGGRERGKKRRRDSHLIVEDTDGDDVSALGEDGDVINLEVEGEAFRARHGLLHQADGPNPHVLDLREGAREGWRKGWREERRMENG